MVVSHIKTSDEYTKAIAGKKVVIKLGAKWCAPCRRIAPNFESLSSRFDGIDFYSVDVDDFKQALASEGATSIPFFSFYRNGMRVETLSGANENKLLVAIANLAKIT
jgi:thioredoxin 1